MKIVPILHNIRSTYNVGAILRTADGLGIEKVGLSGYTPCYDDAELLPHLREKLNRQIAKSALGAEKTVAQEKIRDLKDWLKSARLQGALIVGLENNLSPEEAPRRLVLGKDNLDPQIWTTGRAKKTAGDTRRSQTETVSMRTAKTSKIILILGEEVAGIPAEIRSLMDYFLEIPMRGTKESFNVSIATAIALWELVQL